MAYRFSLGGMDVACDSLDELLAVVPKSTTGIVESSDVQRTQLVKDKSNKPGRKRSRTSRRGEAYPKGFSGRGPNFSWKLARYYIAHIDKTGMTLNEARNHISANPDVKASALVFYDAAMNKKSTHKAVVADEAA